MKLTHDNQIRLHRCWWRMLETKCVGDNYKILVTVLTILVTNIYYFTFKRCRQHTNDVTKIKKLLPTLSHRHHDVNNVTVTFFKKF